MHARVVVLAALLMVLTFSQFSAQSHAAIASSSQHSVPPFVTGLKLVSLDKSISTLKITWNFKLPTGLDTHQFSWEAPLKSGLLRITGSGGEKTLHLLMIQITG
jgi:hypothetical protein